MSETENQAQSYVGRRWKSRDGERKILSIITAQDGSDRLVVSKPGSNFFDLISPESIEKVIQVEESWAAHAQKVKEANNRHKTEQTAAKAEKYDLQGFTDGVSEVTKHRVVSVLSKEIRHNGGPIMTRRDLIESCLKDGWRVKVDRGRRQFTSPTDSYLKEQSITKIGMDYAQYLEERMHGSGNGNDPKESSKQPRHRTSSPGR